MVSEPSRFDSSDRKMASRWSMLIKRICCITHITSEKRLMAVSREKILILGFASLTDTKAGPLMT